MTAREVVPVALRIVGLFCIAAGAGFMVGAWVYERTCLWSIGG